MPHIFLHISSFCFTFFVEHHFLVKNGDNQSFKLSEHESNLIEVIVFIQLLCVRDLFFCQVKKKIAHKIAAIAQITQKIRIIYFKTDILI